MKNKFIYLIATTILTYLTGKVVLNTLDHEIGVVFIMGSYLTQGVLFFFLWKTTPIKEKIYLLVIVLSFVQLIGSIFKIYHVPGAGILLVVGLLSSLITFFLITKSAFQNHLIYHGILSSLMLIQFLLLYQSIIQYSGWLNYPILAITGTILLKNKAINKGEQNILIIVFIQLTIYVIRQLFQLQF